jgi:ABC-type bacteriocin/lantibiotic exporter with double-glycine peptidase domain
LLGSLLDSTVLLFFLPVMFFLSPLVTTFILVICALIVAWLVFTLPIYRRKGKWLDSPNVGHSCIKRWPAFAP